MAFITDLTAAVPTTGTYVNGKPSGVKNDFGDVRGGGTISSTALMSASTFGEGNPVTTIVSGVGGVDAALSQVTDAAFNSGLQVLNLVQTTIAGAANTSLQGGQSNSANEANTPAQLDVLRTYFYKTAVVAGNWNVFNGTFSSISNAVSGYYDIDKTIDTAATGRSAGTDVAANPSQAYPGTLTYRDGSPNPTNDFYQARNNW